jgi:hypothetical protein
MCNIHLEELIVIDILQCKSHEMWKERFYFVNWQLTYIQCLRNFCGFDEDYTNRCILGPEVDTSLKLISTVRYCRVLWS